MYCKKCGKELMDEAVICPECGCAIENKSGSIEINSDAGPASKTSVVLGIIGIVGGVLFAIVGHVCSIISIIFGIMDCTKNKKPTGLFFGIIGEVVSIFSSIIGAVIGTAMF